MRRRKRPGIGRTRRGFLATSSTSVSETKKEPFWVHLVSEMVSRVGLEPTTPSLRGSCSNQLSYRPAHSDNYIIKLYLLQYESTLDISTPSLAKNPLHPANQIFLMPKYYTLRPPSLPQTTKSPKRETLF